MRYNFQWDPKKDKRNFIKHGVSFQKATQIFDDPIALTLFDQDSSTDSEERWITLGQIQGQIYLVVVHTYGA